MKSTRKIIPALVMLLVSAIMLTTASYAWLASSRTVTAGNMTVQANMDVVYMQISNSKGNDATWGNSANALAAESGELELVNAYVSEGQVKWQTAVGATPGASGKEGSYSPVETIDGTYALINTFYVKMSDESNKELKNLTINTVNVTGDPIVTGSFDEALRVLVIAKNAEDEVLGYQCWDLGTRTFLDESEFDGTASLTGETKIANAQNNASKIITLEVYIYYDGEDTYAFTNNLASATEKNISVSFTAEDVTE